MFYLTHSQNYIFFLLLIHLKKERKSVDFDYFIFIYVDFYTRLFLNKQLITQYTIKKLSIKN